jgi:16S rRNA U516 pseudouridylate synthase RsuA-like enzyme
LRLVRVRIGPIKLNKLEVGGQVEVASFWYFYIVEQVVKGCNFD